MPKFTIADLSPKYQAQIAAQLRPSGPIGVARSEAVGKVEVVRVDGPTVTAKIDATPTFIAAGLPVPTLEHRFDPIRRWRFDYAWPSAKVALEVDGSIWTNGRHTRGSGWLKDTEKLNRAAVLGWRMLRCTPDTLTSAETIATLREILGARP